MSTSASLPMTDRPNIFLLTDFGTVDHFVAVMKALILCRCPSARLIDISHDVPPQAIESGCYLLECAWPWLPPGSIVLAVVDPGVGTAREPAIFYNDSKTIIGPNNGLMSFLPPDTPGRVLDKPELWLPEVSSTFHGRDIFAPCAAYIAAGGHWTRAGNESAMPAAPWKVPEAASKGKLPGRIIHFDHFGNAITTFRLAAPAATTDQASVELPGQAKFPLVQTYADVDEGAVLAYAGSSGRLEIAVRGGSARRQLGLHIGDQVYLEPGVMNR